MLPTFITIIVIVAVIVLWTISTQRKLAVLDEHIGNAMSQIGVQLSVCFDVITAKTTPDEVMRQEEIIFNALGRIAMVTEQLPGVKSKSVTA